MSVGAGCIHVKERSSAKHHKEPMEVNVRLSTLVRVTIGNDCNYWWK